MHRQPRQLLRDCSPPSSDSGTVEVVWAHVDNLQTETSRAKEEAGNELAPRLTVPLPDLAAAGRGQPTTRRAVASREPRNLVSSHPKFVLAAPPVPVAPVQLALSLVLQSVSTKIQLMAMHLVRLETTSFPAISFLHFALGVYRTSRELMGQSLPSFLPPTHTACSGDTTFILLLCFSTSHLLPPFVA